MVDGSTQHEIAMGSCADQMVLDFKSHIGDSISKRHPDRLRQPYSEYSAGYKSSPAENAARMVFDR